MADKVTPDKTDTSAAEQGGGGTDIRQGAALKFLVSHQDQPPEAAPDVSINLTTDPFSPAWARIIQPFTWFLLWLIAGVMLVPFLFMIGFGSDKAKLEPVFAWANTILPPAIGFGGAIIGYYFGTRSGKSDSGVTPPGKDVSG